MIIFCFPSEMSCFLFFSPFLTSFDIEQLKASCTHTGLHALVRGLLSLLFCMHKQSFAWQWVSLVSFNVSSTWKSNIQLWHQNRCCSVRIMHVLWNECQCVYDLLQRYRHMWCERDMNRLSTNRLSFKRQSNIYKASVGYSQHLLQ